MTNVPLVSVIVPCFNQGLYLSETLTSVYNQRFPDWECLIINDGSTDNTEEVAQNWCRKDERFKHLKKCNEGLSATRNFGIKASKGTYILPLDADDLIGSKYIELAVKEFENDLSVKLVYCKAEKFGLENGNWILPDYKYKLLLERNLIFSAAFFKKEDFEKTNGYNSNMVSGYEDWDFWLSLLKPNDKVVCLPDTLFFYRTKENSMNMDLIKNNQHKQMQMQLFLNHYPIYFYHFGDPISIINKCKATTVELERVNSNFSWKIIRGFSSLFKTK